MADPRPDFVISENRRGLLFVLFGLTLVFGAWFFIVLFGENQDLTDDPGRWALLPTFVWGLISLVPMILLLAYSLALLTIREREGQVYRLEGTETASPTTPSFLQPAQETTTTAEVAEEPAPSPPQG